MSNKSGITITNAFQKIFGESNRKQIDKGSELYNRSMKLFLQNINIEMDSSHNERKSVLAERFIRTLKNRAYKEIIDKAPKCQIGDIVRVTKYKKFL